MKTYNELHTSLILRKFLPENKRHGNYRRDKPQLYAEIMIDSRHLFHRDRLVYPQELIASAKQSGDCFIFCNGCGVAYCGCQEIYKTTVVHYRESVVWRANKAARMRSYRFGKEQYIAMIAGLEEDLKVTLRRYKKQLQQGKIRALPYKLWEDWRRQSDD